MVKWVRGMALGLAAVVMVAVSGVEAEALSLGFSDSGGYTESNPEYTFMVDDSAVIYNKETEFDPDFNEIWAGSELFVPIGMWDPNGKAEVIATEKSIKNDAVQVSYKAVVGSPYVEAVDIVDAKRMKNSGLPAGAYARIKLGSDYMLLRKTKVSLRLVLSVNRVSYQDTRVTLNLNLQNRVQTIDRNSVYGAQIPSQFHVKNYSGVVTFDFGDNIKYHGRVISGKKYYLNLSREPNMAIEKLYQEPYLEYYSFKGKNDTFAASGALQIPILRKKFTDKAGKTNLYVYRVADDQLQSIDLSTLSYDAQRSMLTIHTKTLGEYVLSNRALMKNFDGSDDNILRYGYAEPEEYAPKEVKKP